jgi:hypothetical protein
MRCRNPDSGEAGRRRRGWEKRGCSASASAGDRAAAAQGELASLVRLPGFTAALSTPAVGTRRSLASVLESDCGTRLYFPSTDPGREVFQPNAAVGLCHGLAPLPARRLRGPRPVDRWSSRASSISSRQAGAWARHRPVLQPPKPWCIEHANSAPRRGPRRIKAAVFPRKA